MTANLQRLSVPGCIAAMAASLMLSACSVLPEREVLTLYQLPSKSVYSAASSSSGVSPIPLTMRVAEPSSSQAIGTTRILVLPHGNEVSAYSGVRWTDPAPVLLRDHIANALRSSGRMRSVTTDAGTVQVDLELDGDLGAFQVEYRRGQPEVQLLFDAIVTQPGLNRIIASKRFQASEPVTGNQPPEVVEAYGRAADRLAHDVGRWAEGIAVQSRKR